MGWGDSSLDGSMTQSHTYGGAYNSEGLVNWYINQKQGGHCITKP